MWIMFSFDRGEDLDNFQLSQIRWCGWISSSLDVDFHIKGCGLCSPHEDERIRMIFTDMRECGWFLPLIYVDDFHPTKVKWWEWFSLSPDVGDFKLTEMISCVAFSPS